MFPRCGNVGHFLAHPPLPAARLHPMSSDVSSAPWRPLVRILCATAGRSATQRALPLYLGVLIVASVLMEGSGVRPTDVVDDLLHSRRDCALAYGVWTIVSVPAIRALLTAPSSFVLRTLPVPRWQVLGLLAVGLLLAELPWAYLWIRGGGLLLGLAHVVAALALATLLLAGPSRRVEQLAAALLVLVLGLSPPWLVLLGVSMPASILGVYAVWLRAPEPRMRTVRTWIGSSAVGALAACYGLLLWRRAGAQLARALGFASLALVVSYFAIRNNPPESTARLLAWALGTLTPALLLAAAGLVGPLLHAEAQLSWLPAVYGTSIRAQRLARCAPLAANGAALATLHCVALGAALALPPGLRATLWLIELTAAILSAVLVTGIARWALRGDGNDSGRLVLSLGAALLGSTVAVAWLGLAGLWLWAGAATLAWLEPWTARHTAWALRRKLER
ncbi:MAG: hypothetical protein RL033_2119 [Pseudomonadota bacterium]|jgi:hypothetical protein